MIKQVLPRFYSLSLFFVKMNSLLLGLAIWVYGSGSCQPDRADYIIGYNMNPTRLLIGFKNSTRTRPVYQPSYLNTTRVTR